MLTDSEVMNGSNWEGISIPHNANPSWWYYYRLFETCLLLSCGVIGTLSNLMIIGAVIVEKRLKYLGIAFIINLALADMLITSITFPVLAMNVWHEGMATEPEYCVFFGIVTVWSASTSMQNLTAIAFDRYVLICHDEVHRRFFGPKLIGCLVGYTWISTGSLMMVLVYYEDIGYYDASKMCSIRYVNLPPWFNQFVVTLYCTVPMAICFFSYFQLFVKIKKSKNRIATTVNKSSNSNHSNKKFEANLFRTLILVFVIFFICWTPYNLSVVLVDYKFHVSHELYRWASNFALINSILNGFIYGLSNKLFRSGYLKIVQLLFCYSKWKPNHNSEVSSVPSTITK